MVFAGEVAAVGRGVTRFRERDRVCGSTVASPRRPRFGAYAEYTCVPEDGMMVAKPSTLTYEEAATVPYGAWLALRSLAKGNIHEGWRVLVYGASGAVGTAAVQLARHFGGVVTGVCGAAHAELVASLGAETIIDYTREDATTGRETYDLVFDAAGRAKTSRLKDQCARALAPRGAYISVDDGTPRPRLEDLLLLKELVDAGALRPVIGRRYPLERIVEAHQYVDGGHKTGNVAITVAPDGA